MSLAARVEADWGSLEWLASGPLGNASAHTLGRVVVRKGMAAPRHRHTNCEPRHEEPLFLRQGRLDHSVGEGLVALGRGDTLVAEPGVPQNARSVVSSSRTTPVPRGEHQGPEPPRQARHARPGVPPRLTHAAGGAKLDRRGSSSAGSGDR